MLACSPQQDPSKTFLYPLNQHVLSGMSCHPASFPLVIASVFLFRFTPFLLVFSFFALMPSLHHLTHAHIISHFPYCCFPLLCRWCLQQQSLWLSAWGSSLWKTLQLTWWTSTAICPPPRRWSSFSAQDPTLWGPFSALQKREVVLTGKIRQTDR